MAGEDARAVVPHGLDGTGLRVGVVRARWNTAIVERLVGGVRRGLARTGVADDAVVEVSVPGSFEVPFGAKVLAESGEVDAVVCIGAVIRGETTHYDLVARECARGIQHVQLGTGVPVAFGVLTTEDEAQALARSEGPGGHNVGEEAALVAVEMAMHVRRFRGVRSPLS
ncbi:MAG TPA: 6,7-dimethyl-8-ribityllumazine synthase [Acidimicrobiales bacterium]|jgi:6,7-dimethyl-8-ribityllumazine synthase|nr:6,7-dimethyl-8-ribityllumazine synthase [Acidimicrobiales bacterium]